jgi:hypothetical protein
MNYQFASVSTNENQAMRETLAAELSNVNGGVVHFNNGATNPAAESYLAQMILSASHIFWAVTLTPPCC